MILNDPMKITSRELDLKLKDIQLQVEDIRKTSLNIIIKSRNIVQICSQFKMPPISLEEKITQATENLNLIFLTEDQKVIFSEIAKEMSALVPFNDFIHKGFILRSIRKWQLIHNHPIALATQMNRPEQLRVGIEILNNMKHLLSRALYIPDEKLKTQFLDEITLKSIELYEELLSVHSFINDPKNQEYMHDVDIEDWTQENKSLAQ